MIKLFDVVSITVLLYTSNLMEMLLTVEQVAQRLQLHPETIRRQLLSGVLRGVKRGRQWRIPESALLETATPEAKQ